MGTLLKTANMRCRIDDDLKVRATEVLNACGLSISDAMHLFLRQVVATQGLPFEVRVPSEKTARAMMEARGIRQQFEAPNTCQLRVGCPQKIAACGSSYGFSYGFDCTA